MNFWKGLIYALALSAMIWAVLLAIAYRVSVAVAPESDCVYPSCWDSRDTGSWERYRWPVEGE